MSLATCVPLRCQADEKDRARGSCLVVCVLEVTLSRQLDSNLTLADTSTARHKLFKSGHAKIKLVLTKNINKQHNLYV